MLYSFGNACILGWSHFGLLIFCRLLDSLIIFVCLTLLYASNTSVIAYLLFSLSIALGLTCSFDVGCVLDDVLWLIYRQA